MIKPLIRRYGQRVAPVFAASALLVLGLAMIEWFFISARQDVTRVRSTLETRLQTLSMWRDLLDTETGQLGLLLTGKELYRNTFEQGAQHVRRFESSNAPAGIDDMDARALRRLAHDSQMWLEDLSSSVQLFDTGQSAKATERLSSEHGRTLRSGLRTDMAALLEQSERKDALRTNDLDQTLQLARVGISTLFVLSVALIGLFLIQLRRYEASQLQHMKDLRAERDRLDQDVGARTAELVELTRYLGKVREEERASLARELHDELGALLTSAKLDTARLRRLIVPLTPDLESRLRHLNDVLGQGVALKRRIIEDLRPSSLDHLGLTDALRLLLESFDGRTDLRISFHLDNLQIPKPFHIILYRVVQESLTNIAKYAQASHVTVTLTSAEERAHLCISDDGVGFDPSMAAVKAHGILGMKYRVEAEGGQFSIDSHAGRGTSVHVYLALSDEPELSVSR